MASKYISPWNHKDTSNRSRSGRRPPPDSSFQMTAAKKLKKHPDYRDSGENERTRKAAELTEKDKIMSRYFGHISTDLADIRISERLVVEDAQYDKFTPQEREDAQDRAKWRVEDAARLDVKLLLRHINTEMSGLTRMGSKILNMWYGPLHAALLINDSILVEWNTSSLIIPDDEYDRSDLRYPFATSVLHHDNGVEEPRDVRGEEIDLIFTATSQKLEILNALVRVIARYNGQCYYHAIRNNCQQFVIEALREMGCENLPDFKEELGEYYRKLESGRAGTDFEDHSNLDRYVKENILDAEERQRAAISTQHKEYLLCQYFEFHIQEMTAAENADEWQCSRGRECKMGELESCIKTENMLMHKFLQHS